jgi:hypothetical protein
MEQSETIAKDYKFTLKWACTSKGWYCEQISIKADTIDDLKKSQSEAFEVMKVGRQSII